MATPTSELVGKYLEEARRIEDLRRQRKKLRNVEAFPFWPHEAVRSTVIVLAFSAAVLYISALMPYFLEVPANPAGQPEVILPDWYLLWSYGLLKPGVANAVSLGGEPVSLPILGPLTAKTIGILLNILILAPLIVLPFISTGQPRRPQEAPWTAAFGVAGIVFFFNVSVFSVNNVIYAEIPVWGETLADVFRVAGPGPGVLAVSALLVLALPLASFLVRWKLLGVKPRLAALVAIAIAVILYTILAYGANLDPARLLADPVGFLYRGLACPDCTLLAWMTWWTTLLAFEVTYWSLAYWKIYSTRRDTYEFGLNLTYFKVR